MRAKLGLELEKLVPNSSRVQYNLACVLARNGEVDAALGWLEEAAANGLCRISLLEVDPDLEGVRNLAGCEVDLRMFPNTGHEFPRNTRAELLRALRFVLDE